MTSLPDPVRQTLHAYLKEIIAAFGAALQSVILYGSAVRGEYLADRSNLNLLLVLLEADLPALQRYAKVHRRWSKEGVVVPLLLTRPELERMGQLFPLEYTEIQERHLVLVGEDPIKEPQQIDRSRLLLQCRQEIIGNLLRLRQRLVEGGGSSEAIGILLPLSITAVLPCLRGLLRASGRTVPSTTETVLEQVQTHLGVGVSAFNEAWQLKCGLITPGSVELPRVFERYAIALSVLADKARSMNAAQQEG
jgi:predicted nucleotidyltransferase